MKNGASASGYRFPTRCARAGVRRGDGGGNDPVQAPIVQSSIFNLGGTADAEAIFSGARKGHAYSRFGNPTVETLAHALADLEGGAEARDSCVSTARAHEVAACVLCARTSSDVTECLAARPHEVETTPAAKSRRKVKRPAEAAWENEGGHILPLTADAIARHANKTS